MNDILLWGDIVLQLIMTLCAVTAIVVTIRQIASKSKVKLKINWRYRLNEIEIAGKNQMIIELVINIVNLGMAMICITECGIQIWDRKKNKFEMPIVIGEPFILRPGECICKVGPYFDEMVDDKSYLRDKVRFYIKYHNDKIYYVKNKVTYAEFRDEYRKWSRSVEKFNEGNT